MSEERRSISEKVRRALRQGGWKRVVTMAWTKLLSPLERTEPGYWNPFIVAAARVARRPVVHAVGDSHSKVLIGVYPFRVTWMGAPTAYNLGKEGSSTRSREQLTEALTHVKKPKDVVLLVLGEVDSRIHIYNQYMRSGGTQPFEELIAKTIESYGAVLTSLRDDGYRVVVHSVPATPYQDNIYDMEHYADDETRARIVAEFNRQLQAWCAEHSIEYLDMYSLVSDERGFIRRELTTDGTHLDRSALPIYRDWVRRTVSPRRAT